MDVPGRIRTLDQLADLYRPPGERAAAKVTQRIDEASARFIDLCPFLVLSTSDGSDSIDASPRGGPPGFLQRLDDRHLAIPDLNGNNRLDSIRNLVVHPFAGLLLLVPGKDETLRINGPAALTTDDDILAGFTGELRRPKAAIVVRTDEVFGHCAKAFRRSGMWDPGTWDALAGAPDLPEIYACQFPEFEAAPLREALAGAYDDDLSRD